MVDEDAGQLAADGLGAQRRHDRGVNAARKAKDDALVPHLLLDGGHGVLDDGVHGPVGLEPGDGEEEVGEHVLAKGAVLDLRVELGGVDAALGALHGGHGAHIGRSGDAESGRDGAHGVAMAHPHLLLFRGAVKQLGLPLALEDGLAVLADL